MPAQPSQRPFRPPPKKTHQLRSPLAPQGAPPPTAPLRRKNSTPTSMTSMGHMQRTDDPDFQHRNSPILAIRGCEAPPTPYPSIPPSIRRRHGKGGFVPSCRMHSAQWGKLQWAVTAEGRSIKQEWIRGEGVGLAGGVGGGGWGSRKDAPPPMVSALKEQRKFPE